MATTPTRLPVAISGALTSARARARVTRRLERALGRFGDRVQRITVRCRDVNGPRGGMDQICGVEVTLRGLPSIVVEKRAETPRKAFDRASTAVRRAVRRSLERNALRATRRKRPRAAAATPAPRESGRPLPLEQGSLIGRRVGRSPERLRGVAERPEKLRRDVWVDTAQPGASASDRKVGAGSTARRNTKLNLRGMSATLEDSAQSRPSRKSSRKSAGRAKRDTNLRLRATRRAHTGAARARKARAAPEATLSGARSAPSSSNDSEGIMPRRFIWTCVLVALVLGSMSCSSTPRRPAEFMMPSSEFTWERGERLRQSGETMGVQGQRIERDGQRLRDQAEQLEAQGRSLIDSAGRLRADGDRLVSEGAALRERGREALDLGSDAIEAVRKLEEAERLRREGEELREKTRR